MLTQLVSFDPARPWEDSVSENALRGAARFQSLLWDLQRLRLFLDRYRQGRFVEYATRERSARIIIRALAPNSGPTCS